MSQVLQASERTTALAPQIDAFDHLEWYVGNARHAAQFWVSAFGFRVVAYAGPETGARDRQSYVLRQGDICFVVTSALDDSSPVARHVAAHGDGVRVVAYRVGDVEETHRRLTGAWRHVGGRAQDRPRRPGNACGSRPSPRTATPRHALVERDGYRGAFLPGYEPFDLDVVTAAAGRAHRHRPRRRQRRGGPARRVGRLVPRRVRLRPAAALREDAISHRVLGAALDRRVERRGRIVQPINEPAPGRRKSQIEEYLDYYDSPGVQHVAMRTDDIVATVARRCAAAACASCACPTSTTTRRHGASARLGRDLPWDALAELGILVDRDNDGYLLQIFTERSPSRPTVFMEIIQRRRRPGLRRGQLQGAVHARSKRNRRVRGNL